MNRRKYYISFFFNKNLTYKRYINKKYIEIKKINVWKKGKWRIFGDAIGPIFAITATRNQRQWAIFLVDAEHLVQLG